MPETDFRRLPAPGTPLGLLLDAASSQRRALSGASTLMLLGSVAGLVHPWLAGNIASVLLDEPGHALGLSTAFVLLVVLLVAQSGITLADQWLLTRVYTDASFELRTRVYDQLQWQRMESHYARPRSDALTLIERDAEVVASFLSGTLVGILPSCVTLVGAAAMMILVDPLYGLLAVLVIPIYVVALRLVRRRLSRQSRRYAEARARANAVADEQLALLPVVKAFGREAAMSERYRAHEAEARSIAQRLFVASGALSPMAQLVAALGVVVLLWLLSGKVLSGAVSGADFLVFFMYAFAFTRPLSSLAGVYGSVHGTWGSAERLHGVLSEPNEASEGERVSGFVDAIVFERVGFAYRERPAVLSELSLTLRRGQVTVLLGPNGAGKSTLLKLLLKFVEPQKGQLRLDGKAYAELSAQSLRRLFAVVPQEMLLLSGSIYDNIALGSAEATPESVEEAARLAHAHDFIRELPEGYQTRVGEGGALLSGGQRQRIALARALVKRAPLLVLDEATAMLDTRTEAAFFDSCREAFRGRTVIVVSHHLADLSFADQVVRIEAGRAVSLGHAS